LGMDGNIFYWVEKKLKRFFGGKTGKTEPQV
jgi:hypothetical protein